ncbi:unnamed protein product [Blepharisma stoltei]|uniref:Cilia- and flagella-associated protein 157 n=1 Tax=Blepharisma stoltei TaxID=1481888 RepID=A0AAU9K6L0_9CILI|nr:unnamed protein product [Blepharisma stoltei]
MGEEEDKEATNLHMREMLNSQITETKLQERINRVVEENKLLLKEKSDLSKKFEDLTELHSSMVKSLQNDLREMTGMKVRAEAQVRLLESEMSQKDEAYAINLQKCQEDHQADMDKKQIEIQILKGRLSELNEFSAHKAEFELKMKTLEEDYEKEKKAHQEDKQNLEREKIKETEKLKKDMLYKIKETRDKVLALNDEQLHITTKFTVLENHRLTTELEYQSKQTEKLMNRNSQLEEQVAGLKRDIEIHKQVEAELAKRSHYCQKIIKKLNTKIKDLEDELGSNSKQPKQENENYESKQDSRMNEELVRFLENKLEESMNRLAQVQMDYNILKAEHTDMQQKFKERSERYRNLGCLLADYLKDLQTLQNELPGDAELTLNINKIASSPIEELTSTDKAALVSILLKQIQPYLSPSNLNIPNFASVNLVTDTLKQDDSLPNINKNKPTISVAVQTSFALGTFELPKLEVDADMVKAPLRPWGAKSTKSPDSSFVKKGHKFRKLL